MKKYNNIFIKKILLAAGSSKRYGDKNKLTEKFKGKYLIQHIKDTLLKVFDPCESVSYTHLTLPTTPYV